MKITFKTPDPAVRPTVSGVYKSEFVYADEAGQPATLSIGFLKHPDIAPQVMEVVGPGTYTVDVDTTLVEDGKRSIEIKAVSRDGRTTSKTGKILVDNNPPVIEILDPTPVAGAGFVGDLPIRVRVTDSGSLIHSVIVTIGDFEWVWPSAEAATQGDATEGDATVAQAGPAAEVDTRTFIDEKKETYEDLVVPTEYWGGGDVVLQVTATDGVAGRDAVLTRQLTFVERPGLDGGELIALPWVDYESTESIEGIRLGPADDGDWALLAVVNKSGKKRLSIIQRSSQGHAVELMTLLEESCAVHKVVDVNRDGMDDILAWCGDWLQRRILVMEQTTDRMFVVTTTLGTAYDVKDLAAGDLNEDGIPDIAFVCDVLPLWTGIMLSTVDGNGDFAGYAAPSFYSGAVKPNHVAIGRFSEPDKNSVVVGASGSGLVTAYPLDENGVPSMGENSSLDPSNERIDDISAMVAVNFSDGGADSDALVVVDSKNINVVGVARLRQDASRRVEAVEIEQTGVMPTDVAAGDVDGDGYTDIAALATGSSMVHVFMGDPQGGFSDPISAGRSLLSGPATDITFADMDMDGFLDIVLLTGKQQLKVIYYRESSSRAWFDGGYQAMTPEIPKALATGHFVSRLSGSRSGFLDAAIMYRSPIDGYTVAVYSSDRTLGQPINPAGSIVLGKDEVTGIVAGNFDVALGEDGSPASPSLDDLVATTTKGVLPTSEGTAFVIAFSDAGHDIMSGSVLPVDGGSYPFLAAVGDFDLGSEDVASMDIAFISKFEYMDQRDWLIRPMLGGADGDFTNVGKAGVIEPISVGWEQMPIRIKSYPLRRSLEAYVSGRPVPPDLMVVNSGTLDVTLFMNKGFGAFEQRLTGSREFAVAKRPIDVAAGYLKSRIDDDLDPAIAVNQLPDLVTLLFDAVLVDYSVDKDDLAAMGRNIGFEDPEMLPFTSGNPVAVEVADINVDGMDDILVLNFSNSTLLVFPNLGQRRFAEPYVYATGQGPIGMNVVDVDADGCPEIVTTDARGFTITTIDNSTSACLDSEVGK